MLANLCAALLGAVTFCCFSRKTFALFQQRGYSVRLLKKSFRGDCRGEYLRLSTYSLTFFVLSACVSPLCLISNVLYVAFLFPICSLFAFFVFRGGKPIKKVVVTRRYSRIIVSAALFSAAICFCAASVTGRLFEAEISSLAISLSLSIVAYFSWFFLFLGKLFWLPFDAISRAITIRKRAKKIGSNPNMIKIAVTGSFGKTTVKEYLKKMLERDFKVLATPLSYNTPLGVCKAAKELTEDVEVFIVEMGARKRGDIKKLCEIVKPDVGIITGICSQHLETFGSVEEVKATKNELIEALPLDGYAVFSADSEGSVQLYEKCPIAKSLVGRNGKEIRTLNEREDRRGLRFDLALNGEIFRINADAFGEGVMTNVCLAAAVALKVGVSARKIALVARGLKNPPHRLNVTRNAFGATIIDDGYNANEQSVKAAAKVLSHFGGMKFVVTPGIVEGGEFGKELNREVGRVLALAADEIIAVGVNGEDIAVGAGRDASVVKVKNLDEAKKRLSTKLKRGDAVLFLNDVPDAYGV